METIMNTQIHDLVLRADRPTDDAALRHLAALDSARPLRGPRLVAEIGGAPVAALSLEDGRVVADPFVRTAEAVELLRLRAERQSVTPAPTRRSRVAALLLRRRAAAA
jgi:hypothetical protein